MVNMSEFLWVLFQALLFFGLAVSAILSLWAIFSPASFLRFEKNVNRSLVIDLSLLDKSYDLDWLVYRHHVMVGMILSVLSIIILFLMIYNFDRHTFELHSLVGDGFWLRLIADMILGVVYFVMILILYIGSIILVRPSALRKVESWSNRWISAGFFFKINGDHYETANHWAEKNPRLFGVIALTSVLVLGFVIVFFELY